MTYVPLANVTLASSATSVNFSSIPSSGFRDLVLVARIPNNAQINLRLNGLSSIIYTTLGMYGNGFSPMSYSTGASNAAVLAPNSFVGPYSLVMNLIDYTHSGKQRLALIRSDSASYGTELQVMRSSSTAVVNNLGLFSSNQNFAAGSTFALYGIAG